MFANMYLAYESLSDGMKYMFCRLPAELSSARNFTRSAQEVKQQEGTALSSFKYSDMVKQIALQLEVRTHPESGRNLCCIGCLTTAIHAKVYQ